MLKRSRCLLNIAKVFFVVIVLISQCNAWGSAKQNKYYRLILSGIELSEEGDYIAAIKELDKAIKIFPNAEVYELRGSVLLVLGRYKEALADFNKAEGYKDFNTILIYFGKGQALYELGKCKYTQCKESLNYINKALKATNFSNATSDKKADIYNFRGLILWRLGDKKDALINMTKALQLKPNDWASHCGKAQMLAALGFKEEAIKSYEKAIELNPGDITLKALLDSLRIEK